MAQRSQFIICNDSFPMLMLNIEPEGAFFPLSKGDEVTVTDVYATIPATVRLTASDKGDPIVSVWPGDGEVRVEKNGVDVFNLIQRGAIA